MVVKVFCGKEFSRYEHEYKQFKEIYDIINDKYANTEKPIYILANFDLSNAQIDVLILTEKGTAILELKSYQGKIIGSENGDWKVITEIGKEEKLPKNLFRQLRDQKFSFLEKFNIIRIGNFERIEEDKLARIKCWGYFEKGSNYDIKQVGEGVHIWFNVITANDLIEKLKFVDAGYLLKAVDMDAIVEGLKLKEYPGFEPIKLPPNVRDNPSIPSEKLESLLKKDKFQWVKHDLLPLFGLLNLYEENGEDGFGFNFTLPLSKENLIDNLVRIRKKQRTIIDSELSEFEEEFKEYIEIKNDEYIYHTRYSEKRYPPLNRPCSNTEECTKYYILKPEIDDLSKQELRKILAIPQKFFRDILSNVRTNEDLMYLAVLKKISENCKWENGYDFGKSDETIKILMELANVDKKVMDYCLIESFEMKFDFKKIKKFLPIDNKLFAFYYRHRFNTSSGYIYENIILRKDIAQYFYENLDKLHIEKIFGENYTKIKKSIQVQEERLPLFEYKNEALNFIEKYSSDLTNRKKLYTFVVEGHFNKPLDYLKDKGVIGIKDDEIILLSKDKLKALQNELDGLESQRIDRNKKEIAYKWFRSGANIEIEPLVKPPSSPASPPDLPPISPVTPPITLNGILVGFECGTGNEVKINPAHLFISGLTQKSGKTTTLEALIQRSGLSTISFITKPGEKCFDKGEFHKPFFQEKAEWKVVEKLFESQLGEKMKDVRAKLIELCKHEKTLKLIKQSIDNALEDSKGTERKSLILLQAYFEDLFKELENKEYTSNLSLKTGINLMDLSSYNEELQSYIINSVLNEILHNNKNTVIIIPEAWKFIPQSKRTPSKYSIEQLIRQGAVNNNFVWFDSQDIAGVDKSILKSVSIWMLGLQTEVNEVEHTIAQIPLPKGQRPTNDQIMNLQVGEFLACFDGKCIKTYVMPNWMSENKAREIAKSKKRLNS